MSHWEPTNANDVELIVSEVIRNDSGARTGTYRLGSTARIVVDNFTLGDDEDLEGLSGVGNTEALGITQGDVEYSFSFTVQGEAANLFVDIAEENGRSVEMEIIAVGENHRAVLTGARAGTREYSGSSGDAVEYEVSGIAMRKRDRLQ